MSRRIAGAVAAALVVLAIVGLIGGTRDHRDTTRAPATTEQVVAVPVPRKTRAELNTQDRVSAQRKRHESDVWEGRPLLDYLPLTVGGVTIDIGGLAADNQRTIIAIDPGAQSEGEALAIYRDALHAYGDSGRTYVPRVSR